MFDIPIRSGTFSIEIITFVSGIVTLKCIPVLCSIFIVVFLLTDRITAVACSEVFVKGTASSIRSHMLVGLHITELRSATEDAYVTVNDICSNGSQYRFVLVNTTTEEVVDVGIVNLPLHITSNLFLTSSRQLFKVSTTDVTLSIVVNDCGISIICTGKIETAVFTTSHRYRYVFCTLVTITVCTIIEFFKPSIASHMEIGRILDFTGFCGRELIKHTTQ